MNDAEFSEILIPVSAFNQFNKLEFVWEGDFYDIVTVNKIGNMVRISAIAYKKKIVLLKGFVS